MRMFQNLRNRLNRTAEDVTQHFNNLSQPQGPPPVAPVPPPESRAPPASIKAVRQLPTIRVAPEDLVDPNNRECCICLDDNRLDEHVTRLPCGHIFHTHCIVDWLSNHSCTCPVCRYELPTDDPRYEPGRIQRMKLRKPRYALHELKRMSIADLLALNPRRLVSGVLEKEDLIRTLIDENRIDVISSPEPVEYELDVLKSMKIGELKQAMAEAGVFFRREDVLMKSDMISIFEKSGRLNLIRPESEDSTANPHHHETITNATSDMDKSGPSGIEGTSEIDTRSIVGSKGDQIVVETVHDDSSNADREIALNEAMDEETTEPTIVMFEIRNDVDSVPPAIPNTQNLSSNRAVSHLQNPVLDETLSEETPFEEMLHEQPTRGHTAAVEEVPGSDGECDSVMESDNGSNAQAPGPIDVQHDTLSPTDDTVYRSRDTRDTFRHYTIHHLQTLGRDLRIDLSHCFERDDIIHTLVNAGITGNSDPSALSPLMFSNWSVSQLRVVASEIQVDLSRCTSKDEMIQCVLRAGNNERPYLRDYLRSLSPLTEKSLSELRAIARELQINISDCLEKEEIIHRLITRNRRPEIR